MKTTVPILIQIITAVAWAWVGGNAQAALPADFPPITVTTYDSNKVDAGYVFLAVATETAGIGTYLMILDNDGSPVWYQKVDTHEIYDFKVQCNGYLSYAPFIEAHSYTGGGDVYHEIRDDTHALFETVTGGNGYVAEGHDFQLLPNGNILQFGYYMSEVDMSQILDGGYPAALVSGGVVQELDAQRNVVFQWRSWDYYRFEDATYGRGSTSRTISMFHLNTINLDTDGNLIVGTPVEVKKINRQTGDVMWILGGSDNQFTPLGAGADVSHFGGHATYRLENGNFLMYDNGPRRGGGTSQVHEYTLDEVAMTATHVWSWAPPVSIRAWHRGNAQRLPNGNTFIGWGGASGDHIPACTEVTPEGEIVFELYFDPQDPQVESYRAFRFPWPPTSHPNRIEFAEYELAQGNDYDFGDTGVNVDLQLLTGDGYNEMTVTREPYAPVQPSFISFKPPRVLPLRVLIDEYGISAATMILSFDVPSFGFQDPENLAVYHRETPGTGAFVALETTYNPVTQKVRATAARFGEFIFGFPDVADVPFAPLLAEVENYRGIQESMVIAPKLGVPDTIYSVNQELPILLSWSPQGLARWFELEIATDQAFTSPVVDVVYQTDGYYVWNDADPETTYFYRVKTWNDGGESDWSEGVFQTMPPMIEVIAPNGSEFWLSGLPQFIRWQDNLAEDVVIELYKDGAFLSTIATNTSNGVYEWEVGLDLDPGYDYAVVVRSATNAELFDMSDAPFRNTAPVINTSSIAPLPAGQVQFEVQAPGAAQITVWGTTSLTSPDWQELQTLSLTEGSTTFTDTTSPGLSWRFYRVTVP